MGKPTGQMEEDTQELLDHFNSHYNWEYNDDHERYMIEQIENKIYQAQENQALKLLSGMN